jgi:hypothetical protein
MLGAGFSTAHNNATCRRRISGIALPGQEQFPVAHRKSFPDRIADALAKGADAIAKGLESLLPQGPQLRPVPVRARGAGRPRHLRADLGAGLPGTLRL